MIDSPGTVNYVPPVLRPGSSHYILHHTQPNVQEVHASVATTLATTLLPYRVTRQPALHYPSKITA